MKGQQPRQKSNMTHQFSQVPSVEIRRSSFDRSHTHKTTFDSGYLIPVLVDEALPGDTFNLRATMFGRLSTPFAPVMDNLHLESFFFAVPIRLIWDNWQKFNGEQRNPGDSTDFTVPMFVNTSGVTRGELHDHMGIPPEITELEFSCLWARAYNLIWNEWFRDENLQDSVVTDTDDTAGSQSAYVLLRRGKRHDYFTSALPWPQKGDAVSIPLGTSASVTGTSVISGTGSPTFDDTARTGMAFRMDDTTGNYINPGSTAGGGGGNAEWNDPQLVGAVTGTADLSTATAVTINALRQAFATQRLFERDARGGTRYTEIVRSHFGVVSPDARLQRPEFLGGGSTPINFTTIPQTSDVLLGDGELGKTGALATFTAHEHGFTKSFTEHCVILGLVSVRADITYQQGLDRMFSRETRFDFFWPALATIGEQSILNKEIYAQGVSVNTEDEDVFGYQERYAEYRYKNSLITGKFRSSDPASLDVWHLSQEFGSLPVLGDEFIEDNPPVDRVIISQVEPQFIFDSYFQMRCARPMPLYGIPGMIDHF